MNYRREWRVFAKWVVAAFGASIAVALALIVVFDPYHNIPFSPPIDRRYMDNNQRFMFPALARQEKYDSALLGTSSVRMLPPELLDEGFDTQFAYLALDAGTPWEQAEIAKLYLKHHPSPDVIIYGADRNWCASPDPYDKLTERPFPPWMYDDNPYNDLFYVLNAKSLEIATRQLRFYFGLDITRYGDNGFEDFLPSDDEYDIKRARKNIYGFEGGRALGDVRPAKFDPDWGFPDHRLFGELLSQIPAQTKVIVLFPPHHAYYYLRNKDRLEACKSNLTAVTQSVRPDAQIFDFMRLSPLTKDDARYWDKVHYNRRTAAQLVSLMTAASLLGDNPDPSVMTLISQ